MKILKNELKSELNIRTEKLNLIKLNLQKEIPREQK